MGTVRISGREALRLLRLAVAQRGADYVDPGSLRSSEGCTYARGSGPGCIVGHALHAAGVEPSVLRELDALPWTAFTGFAMLSEKEATNPDRALIPNLRRRGVIVSGKAVAVFSAAQEKQDNGDSWGVALKAARQA